MCFFKHKWGKWEEIKVKRWVSFLPQYNDTSYGMYLQSKHSYSGPPGKMVPTDVLERRCGRCGKTERREIEYV